MNDLKFYNLFVIWTRSITLILSVVVVVISLSIYNYNYVPVVSADDTALESQKIMYDMIQDRQLIATLVAAQASIFCPLFLLMSASSHTFNTHVDSIWKAGLEQFCQFLMPLGLALSWIFSITFDKRMETVLIEEYTNSADSFHINHTWTDVCIAIADNLKYLIIIALIMEVLSIWVVSFKYVSLLYISQNHHSAIRLIDEEDLEYRVGMESVHVISEKREQIEVL